MRLLLCTDGSPHGQVALRFGLLLAAGASEPATLLGVAEQPEDRGRIEGALHKARQLLTHVPQPITKLRFGHPAEEILDEAAEGAYDLVILGARGRRGVTRFLLGSTSERVARNAAQPVLVVQGEAEKLDRVLICTGGAEGGLAAAEMGGRVAGLAGAEATVLHVMSQLPAAPLLPEAGALQVMPQTPAPPDPDQVQTGDLEAGTQALIDSNTREGAHLSQALAILGDLGVPARARVRRGLVVDEIDAEACEGKYDLVVVGAQAVGGWMRFLLDDVSKQIIQCVGRPVLLVRG